MDKWYLDNLVCPVTKKSLEYKEGMLFSPCGRSYPVVDGVPVMLLEDVEQTQNIVLPSIARAKSELDSIDMRAEHLYLESLGISDQEREGIVQLESAGKSKVDPVVAYMVAATSGNSYKSLLGKLREYPIPELRLPEGKGKMFLDVGCNWGRWSIAASRKGYSVVGIDPSLGAVMAAKRVAESLGLPIHFIVGDARFLPFPDNTFDTVFSYSVLQHFSKENSNTVLKEVSRVLRLGGVSLIQMAHVFGLRSMQHQIMRGFRDTKAFEVRYWSIPELYRIFRTSIGKSTISVDCYFGLGLQGNDRRFMPGTIKFIITISELLRKISHIFPFLKYVADSLYVKSICQK